MKLLGYLASASSCPRCEAVMSAVRGKADSLYCAACGETFQLQLGFLLATTTLTDIDLTARPPEVTRVDLEEIERRVPIQSPI